MEIGEPDRRASPTGPVSPLPRCVQSTVYEPISIVEGIKERFSVSDHSPSASGIPYFQASKNASRYLITAKTAVLSFMGFEGMDGSVGVPSSKPVIYSYFASYDWVAFAQLFGRMIDLPEGMPMYPLYLK